MDPDCMAPCLLYMVLSCLSWHAYQQAVCRHPIEHAIPAHAFPAMKLRDFWQVSWTCLFFYAGDLALP